MLLLINFFVLSFIQFSFEINTIINSTKGIIDIFYFSNSTTKILYFKIPVDRDYSSINSLLLKLSYPYNFNRTDCFASCALNNTNSSNIFYDCQISDSDCDSLDGNKKIIITEIVSPNNCEFENLNSLVSVIYFETTSLELVCANYKLSFFFEAENLEHHPSEDIYFNFPVYYKDEMETAECIFPKIREKIACTIDASQRVFEKGYFINFEHNKTVALTKDLNLTIELEKYVLEDDCGKNINKGKMMLFKVWNYFLFLVWIFLI